MPKGALPPKIGIFAVRGLSGPVAYAGIGVSRGNWLALGEINREQFLGPGVELVLEEVDVADSLERVKTQAAKLIGEPSVKAILGPPDSRQAVTMAPLVNSAEVPTVFVQAGCTGVVIGDYTFRATAPLGSYYHLAAEYLAANGLKKVGVLYNPAFNTLAELADTFLALAKQNSLDVIAVARSESESEELDRCARVISEARADAAVVLLSAPQSAVAVRSLRRAGFAGQILATAVQASFIRTIGKDAEGIVYPTDFSTAGPSRIGKVLIENFISRFGEPPTPHVAQGYDALWWIARAIKASGSATREAIRQGLQYVAREGFEGAMGKLTFEGNDMRVRGTLVRWTGSAEVLLKCH
jgi:branched-chain amino acid transport system substrate-binding protein